MNKFVRMVIAGAVGVAMAFTAPGPATAGVNPTWPDTADCAVGAFTGQETEGPDLEGAYLRLSGWVGPCGPSEKDPAPQVSGRFGFAYMNFLWETGPEKEPRGGRLFSERLRPYESETGTTNFAGRFDFALARKHGQDKMPICLISDLSSKLACVVVEVDATTSAVTVTGVEVTDPVVRGDASFIPKGAGTTPNCGTCL